MLADMGGNTTWSAVHWLIAGLPPYTGLRGMTLRYGGPFVKIGTSLLGEVRHGQVLRVWILGASES